MYVSPSSILKKILKILNICLILDTYPAVLCGPQYDEEEEGNDKDEEVKKDKDNEEEDNEQKIKYHTFSESQALVDFNDDGGDENEDEKEEVEDDNKEEKENKNKEDYDNKQIIKLHNFSS